MGGEVVVSIAIVEREHHRLGRHRPADLREEREAPTVVRQPSKLAVQRHRRDPQLVETAFRPRLADHVVHQNARVPIIGGPAPPRVAMRERASHREAGRDGQRDRRHAADSATNS